MQKLKQLTSYTAAAASLILMSGNLAMAQVSEKTDWPLWGRGPDRNMVSNVQGVNLDFDLVNETNVKWRAKLGSQTYANPVVADGKIYVGSNNEAGYRENHVGDRGCLICFDEDSGQFLWQLTREKLPTGRVHDWPYQGICSTPHVVGDRVFVVTNRCEIMCLDTEGFKDGENDGAYQDEVDKEEADADIVWSLDMMEELGVFPHNLATSSPLVWEGKVYLLTSNGVDEAHIEVPSPRAPCFLCLNAETGEIIWEDNPPFDEILHGQWGSPTIGVVDGRAQVYMPGGDGWIYAYDANTGEEIWRCDLNPKESVWELGARGTRNAIIATPVFYENSVLCAVGQDPEHGEGVGHLWRIDATKEGDISAEVGEKGVKGEKNPNSGIIWHYGGVDVDGSVTGEEGEPIFRRTMSTVAVGDGLVYAADLSGFFHCIDLKTGERQWIHDMLSGVWGSPMLVDGKVFLGNEDGMLLVYEAGREGPKVLKEIEGNGASIYSTPTFANGMMYLTDRNSMYAVEVTKDDE